MNFTVCLYNILLKILRKIIKHSVRIDNNPADEFLLKIFEEDRLGRASKFCVPAKSTALPWIHYTGQDNRLGRRVCTVWGPLKLQAKALGQKEDQKTCLYKPLFKDIMNNNAVNFHRRRFIAAKLYSLRFLENGSLEQRANNNCQLQYLHRTWSRMRLVLSRSTCTSSGLTFHSLAANWTHSKEKGPKIPLCTSITAQAMVRITKVLENNKTGLVRTQRVSVTIVVVEKQYVLHIT